MVMVMVMVMVIFVLIAGWWRAIAINLQSYMGNHLHRKFEMVVIVLLVPNDV